MRVINRSVTALLLTVSALALAGCLGTNYPPAAPALIDESASGTGFVATRGAGFDTLTTTSNGAHMTGGAIDAGSGNAVFTAFTNGTSGNYGFIVSLPGDSTPVGIANADTADTAVINLNSGFTNVAAGGVFPAGTQQASIATDTAGTVNSVGTGGTLDTGNISVDKFGTSQALQDSEYGIWAANGTTAGLSATTVSTAGVFAIGTPTTIMPNSGAATYNGGAAGVATSTNGGGQFSGTATLTAAFGVGGGSISGTITNVKFLPAGDANIAGNVGAMNNINLAGGTIAGNTFSGGAGSATAAGVGAVGGNNLPIDGAAGSFAGQFNGLSAAEVAGTFKLTGGANGAAVIGSFGAKN